MEATKIKRYGLTGERGRNVGEAEARHTKYPHHRGGKRGKSRRRKARTRKTRRTRVAKNKRKTHRRTLFIGKLRRRRMNRQKTKSRIKRGGADLKFIRITE